MFRQLAVAVMLVLPIVLISQHQNRNYLPLTAREMGASFKLKRLGLISDKSSGLATNAGPSGSQLSIAPTKDAHLFTLQGLDKSRKPWQADLIEIGGCVGGAFGYEGDLDLDGIPDIALRVGTCGNGLAPSSHFVAVTFDTAGRPVPFQAEGYFEDVPQGLDSLVDLNRDGRADLIFMNFDDGYWITNIYSVNAGRWSRVKGTFGPRVFPLYTRFLNRANTQATTPATGRNPKAPELSNQDPSFTGRLVRWQWIKESPAYPYMTLSLTLASDAGDETMCSPVIWHNSAHILIDSPEGRRIQRLFDQDSPAIEAALAEIVSKRMKVQLFGQRNAATCSPELIWAE